MIQLFEQTSYRVNKKYGKKYSKKYFGKISILENKFW